MNGSFVCLPLEGTVQSLSFLGSSGIGSMNDRQSRPGFNDTAAAGTTDTATTAPATVAPTAVTSEQEQDNVAARFGTGQQAIDARAGSTNTAGTGSVPQGDKYAAIGAFTQRPTPDPFLSQFNDIENGRSSTLLDDNGVESTTIKVAPIDAPITTGDTFGAAFLRDTCVDAVVVNP